VPRRPLLLALGLALAAVLAAVAVRLAPAETVAAHGGYAVLFALAAALVASIAAIAQAVQRRWRIALAHLAALVVAVLAAGDALVHVVVTSLFEDTDTRADHWSVPADLEVREPGGEASARGPSGTPIDDPDGDAVRIAAHTTLLHPSATVDVSLPSLAALDADRVPALRDALARDPRWHVGTESGHAFAYRRFAAGPGAELHDTLNGYYDAEPRREWRVVIGFDGPVYASRFADRGATHVTAAAGPVALAPGESDDSFHDPTTYLVVEGSPVVVEFYERAPDADRSVTRAALLLVEHTLAAFLRGELAAADTRGAPRLDLIHGMQGGIYTLTGHVNPGEPGRCYVRAFEVTSGDELSAARLRSRTIEDVGYSSDAAELFPYDTELTIYESDWGHYYAARFEVWFVPSNGGAERRLVDDVFRIEGWMR
jgi:hypothetical protein